MNDERRSYDVVFEPGEGLQTRVPAQQVEDQPSYSGIRIRAADEKQWQVRKPSKGKKQKGKKKPGAAAPKRPKKKR